MIKKISIIGAGYVGSSIAYSLMLIEAAEEIAIRTGFMMRKTKR